MIIGLIGFDQRYRIIFCLLLTKIVLVIARALKIAYVR